jgi:hypothetical protein
MTNYFWPHSSVNYAGCWRHNHNSLLNTSTYYRCSMQSQVSNYSYILLLTNHINKISNASKYYYFLFGTKKGMQVNISTLAISALFFNSSYWYTIPYLITSLWIFCHVKWSLCSWYLWLCFAYHYKSLINMIKDNFILNLSSIFYQSHFYA